MFWYGGCLRAPLTLYIRSKFVDIGLASFVRAWEGDHVRLVQDSKGLNKALVGEVSSCLRKIGCRCVLDEQVRNQCSSNLNSLNHVIVMSLWSASLGMHMQHSGLDHRSYRLRNRDWKRRNFTHQSVPRVPAARSLVTLRVTEKPKQTERTSGIILVML